jgi:hypothetical protein
MSRDCDCAECRLACEYKPGWFHPDEIAPLAARLGLTVEQLFRKHLSVDWWAGDAMTGGRDVFVLSPRLHSDAGGDMFAANPHGRCHWYKDGRCAIHESGKPAECAFAHHDVSHAEYLRHRLGLVAAWAKQQTLIARLLGRPPGVRS